MNPYEMAWRTYLWWLTLAQLSQEMIYAKRNINLQRERIDTLEAVVRRMGY